VDPGWGGGSGAGRGGGRRAGAGADPGRGGDTGAGRGGGRACARAAPAARRRAPERYRARRVRTVIAWVLLASERRRDDLRGPRHGGPRQQPVARDRFVSDAPPRAPEAAAGAPQPRGAPPRARLPPCSAAMAPKKKPAADPAAAVAEAAEAARQRKAQAELMKDIKEGVFRWGEGRWSPLRGAAPQDAPSAGRRAVAARGPAAAAPHARPAFCRPPRRQGVRCAGGVLAGGVCGGRLPAVPRVPVQGGGPWAGGGSLRVWAEWGLGGCGSRGGVSLAAGAGGKSPPPTPPPFQPQTLPPPRQNLKLGTAEVGYGEDANHQLSRRLWATYFGPNPRLFEEVFGYPAADAPAGGLVLSTMRLWRNEFIAVTCAGEGGGGRQRRGARSGGWRGRGGCRGAAAPPRWVAAAGCSSSPGDRITPTRHRTP
jgi:hypothetical protein